jgi:poly(3-hydroxybutyrate) depolymerase
MSTDSRFDILSFGFNAAEDEKGMLQTVHSLNQLITAEVDAGIPANRIVLGGFSQGAAMTVLTGLTAERKLAGLAVLSGWLPLREKIKAVRIGFAFSWALYGVLTQNTDGFRPRSIHSDLLGARRRGPSGQARNGASVGGLCD